MIKFPRNILEFQRDFATEESCARYLIGIRWPEGFRCIHCNQGDKGFWFTRKFRVIICKKCRNMISITAGTVMHNTRQTMQKWLWAAYLVSTDTTGFSAVQLQRQLGLKRYETAFQMLHKFRSAMVRPERDKLSGVMEVDETLVGGKRAGRPGRGALGKSLVVVAVSLKRNPKIRAHPRSQIIAGRIRLRHIPNATAKTLSTFVKDHVEKGSEIRTDGWTGYSALSKQGYKHFPSIEGTVERAAEILPHIHIVFSNLKSWLLGTHHGVSRKHLQAYLNEFAFRFNRRRKPMKAFQSLLGLVEREDWPTYKDIYAKKEAEKWEHVGGV